MLYIVCAVIFVMTVVLTAYIRKFAISQSMLDVPNSRSSHSVPTPRGGGVSIVICFIVGVTYLATTYGEIQLSSLLLVSGILVAVIGFLDDRGHVSSKIRIVVHFLSVSILVYANSGMPDLHLMGILIPEGVVSSVLAVIGGVWILNLFNFMDGIDGLAGVEAVTSLLIMSVFLYLGGEDTYLLGLHVLLAAASLGFLVWNIPPAKIFMGDAGSGFLGLMIGGLAIFSSRLDEKYFWCWMIMLGVFIIDASVTLIRRLLNGEKIYEAHRSHAYQYASRQYGGHKPVTLAVLLINLLWLAPLSWLVFKGASGSMIICIAYLPILFLALKYHAGSSEKPAVLE